MLTEKDEKGNWRIKGIPWEMLHTGKQITEEVYDELYACLMKLKEYEDTGLNPKEILTMAENSQTELEEEGGIEGEITDRDSMRFLWEDDDMPESNRGSTYTDICQVEDEDRYEECPYYCMGVCCLDRYGRCPYE